MCMTLKLNNEELGVLFGHENSRLSHEAKLTYVYLRQFMDYKTVLVGFKRVVSYQSIREALEYEPPQGSTNKAKHYTKDNIRSFLTELERTGLIKWIKSPQRGLFFECLLADTDKNTQKYEPPLSHPNETPLSHPAQDLAKSTFVGEKENEEPPQDFEKSHTPPLSVNRIEKNRYACEKNFVPEKAMQWVEYMVGEQGFGFHEAQTAKTIPLFVDWCNQKLTIDDVEQAIGIATAWLANKGKSKPYSPVFYREAVNQLLNERKNLQAQKSQRVNSTNNAGSQNTNSIKKSAGTNYGTVTARKSTRRVIQPISDPTYYEPVDSW